VPVKVLVLGHTAELGGAEIGMVSMARYLPADVRVVLLEEGPLVDRLRAAGCAVEVRDLNAALTLPARDRRTSDEVVRYVRALTELRRTVLDQVELHGVDVVLLNSLRVTRLVAACALPRRVRCVTMLRDGLRPPHISRRDAVVHQIAINAVSSAVVANSAWTASQLVTPRPLSVVPPFVAADFFETPLVHPADDALRVLMLGRMAHWKGQLLGLRALAACRTSRRLAVTVAGGTWFGETRHQERIREFAREHPELQIDVPGPEVVDLIDRHDVLLHTSLMPEPFGQVVVQGMARGRVVVAADSGGPAEVVRSGHDGLLYRTGDEQELTRTLERVAAGAAEIAALGDNAARTAQDYRPERTAERLTSALERVVGAYARA
jgi:glycosyltransferase involved in cell wall biosynthesis